jgi:hypothetical protein
MAKYFIKGYEGDLSTDAIRAAAQEANIVESSKPSANEEQAWSRVNRAASAAETSEPPVDYVERIKQARSKDEVMHLLAQARAEAENY